MTEEFDFGFDLDAEDVDFGFDLEAESGAQTGREHANAIPDQLPPGTLAPQKGPQTAFLSTTADVAIYGGAAGGGKSYALLLEPLRHYNNPMFSAVIFRRNSTQVRNEGGLWHESRRMYSPMQGHPREAFLDWTFPSGSRVKFSHLEHEQSVHDWHGSQIPLICFDELTHFTERMFFYMLSRNRSMSGIRGYMRATTNPDSDSWVRQLIDWWIDEEGWPIAERSGVIRWFIRVDDEIQWADTKEELIEKWTDRLGEGNVLPKSFTFIPSSIYDNQALLKKDPSYLASLMALPMVDRMRLLGDGRGGNWNVRYSAGSMFRREWFKMIDAVPSGWMQVIRFWDRAATKPSSDNPDPDYTRGLLLYRYPDNTFVVGDLKSTRDTPYEVETLIKSTANHDGPLVKIKSQRDPGSAGVAEGDAFVRMLVGHDVTTEPMVKSKISRAKPVSAQVQAGNVRVLRAPWNKEFFTELENFPEGKHDDIVDVLSGAFNELTGNGLSILDVC